MILLDTHVLVWFDERSERLGPRSLEIAEAFWRRSQLFISAVSFWEAALLRRKRRLELEEAPRAWRRVLLSLGLQELGLDGEVAALSAELEEFHGDPADRFLVATALAHDLLFMTADSRILAWSGLLQTIDARS